ncbi:MAG TPA: nuclease [Planctomycetaceae bacterium]|nr:nuclease [Planctomycetaceae bacterium]
MRYLAAITTLLLAGLLTAAQPKVVSEFTGRVVGVTDGDTVKVLVGTQSVTVRLEGIDAPETGQAFGTRSKQALSALVFGKTATVQKTGEDRFGRTLGAIIADGVNANAKMVEGGWAWHYKKYSTDAGLAALERQAKDAKRGLWADPNPIAPWDYRASRRAPKVEPASGTGEYWLNTSSGVRHNSTCENFKKTKRGRLSSKTEGRPCGICGG